MSTKIIGIGETVLDVIFRDDQPSAAVPGGSTFNAIISLGRTARRVYPDIEILMVTEVGDDHIGNIVTSFMEKNGISTSAVTCNKGTQTHISMAFLDADNNAQYEFYKDHAHASLSADKVSVVSFEPGDIVIFGSYFAVNPVIRDFTRGLLVEARKAGATIYYDINFRKSHAHQLPEIIGNIRENCRFSDWVRGSDEDFGVLFGTMDPERIYSEHVAELCPNFICTCGGKPVHIFMPGYHETVEVPEVETVSTIGAGDSFNAGFVFGMIQSAKEGKERAIADIVTSACRFSANVCASINNYVDESFVDDLLGQ